MSIASRRQNVDAINARLREGIDAYMLTTFKIKTRTEWNLFANTVVTTRVDGERFTPTQRKIVAAMSWAYCDAMGVVR